MGKGREQAAGLAAGDMRDMGTCLQGAAAQGTGHSPAWPQTLCWVSPTQEQLASHAQNVCLP